MIVNSRFKIYSDYLETHGDDYAQVFISDTRDVIFQGDIFAPFKNYSNWLGYATEFKLIGEDRNYNYPWLLNRFGKAEADKLVDKRIICAGTTIGSIDAMKIFCGTMWKMILQALKKNYDQATMNYLVWNNLLPIENLIEFDVISGEIFTNGLIKTYRTRDDFILRGDGGIPAAVHQYDRHKELVQLVDRIYRDKNFSSDERFADVRSVLEQVDHLFFYDKINDAARLCMNTISNGANFSGNADRLLKLWENILSRSLTPAAGYLELLIQNALQNAQGLSINHVQKILTLLIYSVKNRRAVDINFKNFVAGALVQMTEQNFKAGNAQACFMLLDAIDNLELPPDKNFYLLTAKVNRTFGRKTEALEAYKKLLDFS